MRVDLDIAATVIPEITLQAEISPLQGRNAGQGVADHTAQISQAGGIRGVAVTSRTCKVRHFCALDKFAEAHGAGLSRVLNTVDTGNRCLDGQLPFAVFDHLGSGQINISVRSLNRFG